MSNNCFKEFDFDDKTQKVWQYMDIPRFISMLDKEAIYFSTSEGFSDPFEGVLTKASLEFLDSQLDSVSKDDLARYIPEWILNYMKDIPDKCKSDFFISCWHYNDCESMAMWSIYAKSNKGISIQSNLQKLEDCLLKRKCYYKNKDSKNECLHLPNIHIRPVEYINREKFVQDFSTPEWNLNRFFYKLKSYCYEQEVRAVIDLSSKTLSATPENDCDYKKIVENGGIYVNVSPLNSLIEKIYVCPLAPNWVFDVVKSITGKYGVDNEKVTRSSLTDKTYY